MKKTILMLIAIAVVLMMASCTMDGMTIDELIKNGKGPTPSPNQLSWFDATASSRSTTDVLHLTFTTSEPASFDSTWDAPCNTTAYYVNATDSLFYVPKTGSSIVMTDADRISFGTASTFTFYTVLMERVNETFGESYTDVDVFSEAIYPYLYSIYGDPLFELYYSVQTELTYFTNVESIEGLDLIDVSAVTDFSFMFNGDTEIPSLDLSSWDVSNGVDFSYMFGCDGGDSLATVNISNWDFTNAETIFGLFYGRDSLTEIIGLNELDVSNVKDFSWLFSGCEEIVTLDISNWDLSEATTVAGMFSSCESMETLKVGANFKVDNCTDISWMFKKCKVLANCNINGTNGNLKTLINTFNISNVTNISGVISGCLTLDGTLDLTSWDVSNVTDMGCLFYGCKNVAGINISTWNTANVTDMGRMFYECESLDTITYGTGLFNTSKVTDMQEMFDGCKVLTDYSIVSQFDVRKVTTMWRMFSYCYNSGVTLDIRNWNTESLTEMDVMFDCCSFSKIIFGTGFDVSGVGDVVTNDPAPISEVCYTGTEEEWNASGIQPVLGSLVGEYTTKTFNYHD